MKYRIFLGAWLAFNTISSLGWGQVGIDPQDVGSLNITQPAKRTPFSFETHLDAVSNAKIREGYYKEDEVQFAEADVELGMVVYYCPAYEEGLRLAVSYTATYLRWAENPWFDQDHYNTVSLKIGGFSKRIDQWFWRAGVMINMDADEWSAYYTSYDILLWGRYEYCKNVGIHIGFWAETGLRLDRIWPIIGADWQISPKWKLNLVYPFNVAIEYALTKKWALALAGRNFDSRHRVHDGDGYSTKRLVRYENIGAEFMIKYDALGISANIHAGTTMGGKYRIANCHNHHPYNYKLKPAGYVGGEVDVKF